MTSNIITSHIFPENVIHVPQVVQKIWRFSSSTLAIFFNFLNFWHFLLILGWKKLPLKSPALLGSSSVNMPRHSSFIQNNTELPLSQCFFPIYAWTPTQFLVFSFIFLFFFWKFISISELVYVYVKFLYLTLSFSF